MDSQFEAEKELKRACFKEIVGKDHKDSKAEREERGEIDPFRCDKAEKHRKEMTVNITLFVSIQFDADFLVFLAVRFPMHRPEKERGK